MGCRSHSGRWAAPKARERFVAREDKMLALVIILGIVALVELIACFVIHADRKKTHEVFLFMSDMVSTQGKALQKALEELKDSSKYAEPAEASAAIGEISRFIESFNETVEKQTERVEAWQKNKWHKRIIGLFTKKKSTYVPPAKKKESEKVEAPEEKNEEDSELKALDEKLEKKLAKQEDKPLKKIKRIKKRVKRPLHAPGKEESTSNKDEVTKKNEQVSKPEDKIDSDTDIDLAPPPQEDL